MTRPAWRGRSDDRGAVLAVIALSLTALIAFSAMAIDLGRLMVKRRDVQALADVVALDLVRDLNGGTKASYNLSDPSSPINQHKSQTVARNGGSSATVTIDLGCSSGKGQTFDPSCTTPTAVKATATDSVSYFFAQVIGQSSGTTTRTAVATLTPTMDAQIGSFLLGVSLTQPQVDLLNSLTGGYLGSSGLGITAVGWQGLASTSVTLQQVAAQMGLGSPDQLLTGTVNASSFFKAVADAGAANGASAATVTAARAFQTGVSGGSQVSVGSYVGSASSGYGSAAGVGISMLGLLEGGAQAVNGTNTVSIPTLNVNLLGIGNVAISLALGAGMHYCTNVPVGNTTKCKTSQVDLTVTTTVANLDMSAVLGGLTNPLLNGTITTRLQVAGATATPTAIGCPYATSPSATISLTADPVTLTAAESLVLSAKVLGVSVNLLQVAQGNTAAGTTTTGGSASYAYTSEFMPPKGTGTTKHIGGTTYNLSPTLDSPPATATVLGALPLPLATLLTGVNSELDSVLLPLITGSIFPLVLNVGSIELGGGDVGALDLRCTVPLLAG